jgi:hypothetical protein
MLQYMYGTVMYRAACSACLRTHPAQSAAAAAEPLTSAGTQPLAPRTMMVWGALAMAIGLVTLLAADATAAQPTVARVAPFQQLAMEQATAVVTTSTPLHRVDPRFLGVNIDSGSLTNKMDLNDKYLTLMASQLTAAVPAGRSGGPFNPVPSSAAGRARESPSNSRHTV